MQNTPMTLAALLLLAGTLALSAQQPQIQNGQVEARHVTSLDGDIAAIAAAATEPTWVGWREVASAGMGNACCWYQWDGDPAQRGCPVEPAATDANGNTIFARPQFPSPSGPARLEAGTEVLVMVRLVDKQVERIRTYSDDCPLDAGGRTVYWLDSVAAADSVKYLQSLITLGEKSGLPNDQRRRLNSSAISAIGLHRDSSVDVLIALAKQAQDSSARGTAFSWLGRSRDARAIAFIDSMLKR